ncbi:dynein axonemal assembly factor 11 isoform X2 [Takifugu flavidus]|uniref:dynein axonemal assembly factor 11 isoform X2 n=1 Tax=Takifugu flavidus TaxID=433684 RepID=UPI0025447A6D|nr:dynein axonemal assembly factor 11 isoform X2 [Takifugu flavidus]
MVFITEEMIRMRAEHNDKEICSLEEVSLHQQNIEKIEHLDRWCRNLKILYLQNNLIPRMENLGHLKKLQYLNLALNNIEVIENLEGCESLEKLDLTVNFVGRLSSVERLKHNPHLTELFLVGNPCTKFQGYREYVVVALPQLKWLDGAKISRSERIRACQRMEELKGGLQEQEEEHVRRRQRERQEAHIKESRGVTSTPLWVQENQEEDPGLEDRFWNTPCEFSPESRVEAHRHLEEKQRAAENKGKKPKAPRTLVTAEGRPLNINEPKLEFRLTEDDDTNSVVLDLAVYRHMDTSLMDVDVQPTFARVTVKDIPGGPAGRGEARQLGRSQVPDNRTPAPHHVQGWRHIEDQASSQRSGPSEELQPGPAKDPPRCREAGGGPQEPPRAGPRRHRASGDPGGPSGNVPAGSAHQPYLHPR